MENFVNQGILSVNVCNFCSSIAQTFQSKVSPKTICINCIIKNCCNCDGEICMNCVNYGFDDNLGDGSGLCLNCYSYISDHKHREATVDDYNYILQKLQSSNV